MDMDISKRKICNTCLSWDREIITLNEHSVLYQMYRLIMSEFVGEVDPLSEQTLEACWECTAMLKKFIKFRQQAHVAQEHLKGNCESKTVFSQSLSSLQLLLKLGYDKIYNVTRQTEWSQNTLSSDIKHEPEDIAKDIRDNVNSEQEEILGVPGLILDDERAVSHIDVKIEPIPVNIEQKDGGKFVLPVLHHTVGILKEPGTLHEDVKQNALLEELKKKRPGKNKLDLRGGYITEYMNEVDMLAFREEAKKKIYYTEAAYKCETCILGFYTRQHIVEHLECAHKAREGTVACRVCHSYVEEGRVSQHVEGHYMRHVCRLCGHAEATVRCAQLHVQTHLENEVDSSPVKIRPVKCKTKKKKESAVNEEAKALRKLLSKTKAGYKCLYCDMYFELARYRKSHMDRHHRERLQCDLCKKKFVNRTTLIEHLRLHEGPLPRQECAVCNKMVRVINYKYHLQRHQNTERYECKECGKVFTSMMTYQGHLKYSRAHASDQILKFRCPTCAKGYPTQEAMQDHFNYQHLGKTSHKCPVCDKPIVSRANVERHVLRVHGEKKEKPRNHVCQQCGKRFIDKRSLNQHKVIHSGDRPLSCDICHQTFKQKPTLLTHKKRVHNVTSTKKIVEFINEMQFKVEEESS